MIKLPSFRVVMRVVGAEITCDIREFTCLYTNIFVFVYKPKITYTTQKLFVYEHINFHHLNKFCPCKDPQLFVYEQIRVCIRTILHVYKHYEGSYTNTLLFIQAQKHVYKQFMFVCEHRYFFQIIQP